MAENSTITTEHIEYVVDEKGRRVLMSTNEKWLTEESGKITSREVVDETPDVCKVTPIEAYMSTNMNSKITSYEKLATRIFNILGYPAVSVTDLHRDGLYEAITMAVEFFTRYGGHTVETLIFDSRLYEENKGIRLDWLYTIASVGETHKKGAVQKWINRGPDQILKAANDVYVTLKPITRGDYFISDADFNLIQDKCKKVDRDLLCYLRDISKQYPEGIEEYSVISGVLYEFLIENRGYTQDDFKKSKDKILTAGGEELTIYMRDEKLGRIRDEIHYNKTFDYDLMDYRKVKGVSSFVEGSNRSVLSMFTQDMSLNERAFYSWELNNRGFGLLERYCLNEWASTRNKILALEKSWHFNPDTQYFTITPQPKPWSPYTAIIEAYVEKPLKDIITDPWVFQYALALTKIVIGNIRGKWGDVQLLGGGVISGNRFTQEGNQEKEKLEQMLIEKGGYGGVSRPIFFIG